MGGKNQAPPAPNYGPLIEAQTKQAERQYALEQQQFEWAKGAYDENKKTSDLVTQKALAIQDENLANARKDRARYESVFQPQEDALVRDANEYASDSRKMFETGRAQAAVGQQFDAARNNATRELESYGVNPSATRFAGLDVGIRTQQAAAQAAAGTQAGLQVDATGRALRADAINLGRGYPAQSQASYGTTMAGGNQAVNSGLSTTASGANTMGTATQYAGLGNQSYMNAGTLMNNQYQNQMAQFNANQNASSGWGSVLGTALGIGAKFIKPFAAGGEVPPQASPTGGKAIDDVPAQLTAGEYVVPRDVVEWEGLKGMQGLVQRARAARQQAVQMQEQGGPNISQMAQGGASLGMARGGAVRRGVC